MQYRCCASPVCCIMASVIVIHFLRDCQFYMGRVSAGSAATGGYGSSTLTDTAYQTFWGSLRSRHETTRWFHAHHPNMSKCPGCSLMLPIKLLMLLLYCC